ncbi:MAG: DNA recombination protein RmuC [Burkholderiales bacterium]|nr:DNA recombination protein RmuC [Burkholderiales bacterium]
MPLPMSIALLALLALNLLLLLWLLLRRADEAPLRRLEDGLRGELGRQAQAARADLGGFQQLLLAQGGEVARTQNEQIDSFRTQLAATQTQTEAALRRFSETLAEQLQRLSEANERRLLALQEGNEKKLDQMRATVDEKLQATLEQRLGASFKQVAGRLEQVHKGLGEMQSLARDVGSLNRVLTNVKTRGVFGEVQLAALLEQVFTPEQYATHVATVPGSNERVEFAIRLPGRGATQGAGSDAPLWLPIDAKFPREDYERLLDAAERADAPAAEVAGRAIEQRLRQEARSIREKYVAPPHTTDFAILFVPTEGLYAEALRRPGLAEALQREHKVMLAGPTTLLALLNSLQMGFRTLVLEKRSAEVWEVLGAVKTEFAKFGEVLARTRKKLEEASNTIDLAETRTRAMARQLRSVEALPEVRSAQLLPGLAADARDVGEPD